MMKHAILQSIIQVTLIVISATFTLAQNSSLLHDPGPSPARSSISRPEMIPTPVPMAEPSYGDRGTNAMAPNALPSGPVVSPEYIYPNAPPIANVSPLGLPDHDPAIGLRGVSWTYQPAPPLRQFRIQDPVQIRVDEIARMQAEGEQQKRRNSIFSAVLSDWLKLTRLGLVPDPQEAGDPTVAAKSQSNFRSEASVEARESLSFNVTARIVDIRPNGNLVLEARKTIRHNDNLWETSLSGICRAQDIGPDNVVLSKDLIDLEINKEDRGQLRDGYQRGWFQKAMDRVKPF